MRQTVLATFLWVSAAHADPILSIAGTMASDGDYDRVLQALSDVGAKATPLSLFWDDLEPNGTYAPDPDWPAIANAIYPANNLQIALMFSVLDTVADRRPSDLQALPYNDPAVIARFTAFLTEVLTRMPDVELTSVGIGNEVDGVLTGAEWDKYGRFFVAAREVVHGVRPGVPVGMTITWAGLIGPEATKARALADLGDVWMINYYPLLDGFRIDDPASLPTTLDAMLTAAQTKSVYLTEVGYPSGGCGATPVGQVDFVRGVLEYADDHADRIGMVTLVWLHDLSADEVSGYTTYYGIKDACFADYLTTLGLRTADGTDKPAFAWLRDR